MRPVIRTPAHPYTQGLLAALPKLDNLDEPLTPVPGDIPSPLERPPGCVFNTRCSKVVGPECMSVLPTAHAVEDGHTASCHIYRTEAKA